MRRSTADGDIRERIADRVERSPGIHFRGLVRALDVAPGQVQYHLRRLASEDRIVAEEYAGRTHYFTPETAPQRRRAIALLRRETARDLVATLVERGPSSPATVAEDIDVARSTLEWHLGRLATEDVVRKEYDDAGRVTLVVPEPERVGRVLEAIRPSLPGRLVDRFTRLVDRLLEE